MTERESILFLLNDIKDKLGVLKEDHPLENEIEIKDSFHKYDTMRIKITINNEKDDWFIKIQIRQKRFVENHNNNDKSGASWLLWSGKKEDIKKGINEAESNIDYIMEVYESVYKFDLR
jgi:hypothetical protein